eukprot:scaffold49397_cov33-Attheya_sp.AAC.1
MQRAMEAGDPEPDPSSQFVRRNYCCGLCGGCHTSIICRKSHDGKGHYMSTIDQNACLASGFLIIEIKKFGKTILPKSIEEFNMMRQTSDMSTNSFHPDAVNLSDSEEDNESITETEIIDTDSDCVHDPEVLLVPEDNDDESSTLVVEADDGSNYETKKIKIKAIILPYSQSQRPLVIPVYLQKKHLLSYLSAIIVTSMTDSRLAIPLRNYLMIRVSCFHSIHPKKVSMFTHMGIPHMASKDNSEYGDDDIQRVLLNQAGSEFPSSPPTNMILDLNHGKERHLGVVYSQSHFGVIKFILNHQIIVILDNVGSGARKLKIYFNRSCRFLETKLIGTHTPNATSDMSLQHLLVYNRSSGAGKIQKSNCFNPKKTWIAI